MNLTKQALRHMREYHVFLVFPFDEEIRIRERRPVPAKEVEREVEDLSE